MKSKTSAQGAEVVHRYWRTLFGFNQVFREPLSLPDLWPGGRQDRPQQVESGHGERNRLGAASSLPGAGDRCERRLSSSKLLRTEAENKHFGFRDDIPRYQPLANSSSYIRGQHTAVPALMQVGPWQQLQLGGKRRKINTRSSPTKLNTTSDAQTPVSGILFYLPLKRPKLTTRESVSHTV